MYLRQRAGEWNAATARHPRPRGAGESPGQRVHREVAAAKMVRRDLGDESLMCRTVEAFTDAEDPERQGDYDECARRAEVSHAAPAHYYKSRSFAPMPAVGIYPPPASRSFEAFVWVLDPDSSIVKRRSSVWLKRIK